MFYLQNNGAVQHIWQMQYVVSNFVYMMIGLYKTKKIKHFHVYCTDEIKGTRQKFVTTCAKLMNWEYTDIKGHYIVQTIFEASCIALFLLHNMPVNTTYIWNTGSKKFYVLRSKFKKIVVFTLNITFKTVVKIAVYKEYT